MADFDQLARDISEVRRSVPTIASSPGLVVASAQSGNPVATAEVFAAFQEATYLKTALQSLDDIEQMSTFGSLNDAQKRLLTRIGYVPPHTRPHVRGWFERTIGNAAGKAVSVTLGNFVEHAANVAEFAHDATLGNAKQFVNAWRMLASEYGTADPRRLAVWQWGSRDWGDAWRAAGDDIPDWIEDPEVALARNSLVFNPQQFEVLVDASRGMDQFQLMAKYGAPLVGETFSNPDFQKGIDTLQANQFTIGRAIIRDLGISSIPGFRPGEKEKLAGIGPEVSAFGVLSGSADALVAWYGDPLNKPLQAAVMWRRAMVGRKWAITADNFRAASTLPAYQRAATRLAAHLDAGDVPAAIREFPELTPFAGEFARKPLRSADEVTEWFAGKAALVSQANGRAAGFYEPVPLLIRSGPFKEKFAPAVESALRGIEKLESNALGRPLAIGIRRFTNLVPKTETMFLDDSAETVEVFRQTALFSLGRERTDELLGAYLAADDKGKFRVYLGMVDEMFDAFAGSKLYPELDAYRSRFIGQLEGRFARRFGSNVDGDALGDTAIFSHQLSEGVGLPDLREMVRARRATALYRSLPGMGHISDDLIDGLMDQVWKPLVLLRLGLPIRAGGEEVARAMLENGFVPTIRARMSASAVKAYDKRSILDADAEGLKTIRDYMVNRTMAALSDVKSSGFALLAGEKYLRASEVLLRRYGPTMLPHGITALDDVGGVTNRPETLVIHVKKGNRLKPISVRPGRQWKGYNSGEWGFDEAWHAELARHNTSPEFRVALEHLGDDAAAEDAVYAWLKSKEGRKATAKAARRDWQAGGFADQDTSLRDWSRRIVESTKGLVTGPQGVADDVVAALKVGRVPTVDALRKVAHAKRPMTVQGRVMEQVWGPRWWDAVTTKGFSGVGRMINWISRQPIFVHEFARALDEVSDAWRGLKGARLHSGGDIVEEQAFALAVERTYPLIDHHEVRSQFAVANRNLFPFWHAQEQFIKRWGRAVLRDPSIVRRAQLTMEGLRHSGALHTDPQTGEDFFYYPAVMWTQGLLSQAGKYLWGQDIPSGIPVALTGKAKFVAAGIESPRAAFVPSPGPIMAIPLAFARSRWPEFGAAAEEVAIGSEQGLGRPWWEQVLPTNVRRLGQIIGAFAANSPEDFDGQMASAMNQAAQWLEANGQGIAQDASPNDIEAWQERVRNFARTIMVTRFIYGFAGPAAPQPEFIGNLSEEFRTLLAAMPYDEAMGEFLRRHPGADPFTVFSTESVSPGAFVSPSAAAGEWLRANDGFVKSNPEVAGYFLPDAPGGFDYRTWQDLFTYGLRERKGPEQMWREIKIRQASGIYYPSKDRYEAAIAQVTDPRAKAEMESSWRSWQESFFITHPIFYTDHIAQGQQRAAERTVLLNKLAVALDAPDRPQTSNESALRLVIDSWRAYEQARLPFVGRRDGVALAENRRLREGFAAWGRSLTDPLASQLFHSLIEPGLRVTA